LSSSDNCFSGSHHFENSEYSESSEFYDHEYSDEEEVEDVHVYSINQEQVRQYFLDRTEHLQQQQQQQRLQPAADDPTDDVVRLIEDPVFAVDVATPIPTPLPSPVLQATPVVESGPAHTVDSPFVLETELEASEPGSPFSSDFYDQSPILVAESELETIVTPLP